MRICLFVCFDSLRPSQHFFSHVGTGLPALNQYLSRVSVLLNDTTQCHLCGSNQKPLDLEPNTLPLSLPAPKALLGTVL